MVIDRKQLYLERFTALQSLRLTSTRFRGFADAVTHRSLSLIDDEVHQEITYRLAERLTDISDKICHYVRNLHVVGFKGDDDSYCLNNHMILNCLGSIQKLNTFSWRCNSPISTEILDELHQRFPKAQLCASVNFIDPLLLSTTQLHRLAISVPCAHVSGHEGISLFRPLKKALLQLPSLRHLLINSHHDSDVDQSEGAELDSLQLPLEPGDKLPPLISFEIVSASYVFTKDHCMRLLESIDCNKLQHLTLGSANTITFFEVFLEKLPYLTHLDVSYISSADGTRYLRRLEAFSGFIARLRLLRGLVLRCNNIDLRDVLPKVLADVHGPSLLHLSLQARHENVESPNYRGNIRTYLWKFTSLASLNMAFPDIRSYHRCPDCQGYQWGVSKPIILQLTKVLICTGKEPFLICTSSSVNAQRQPVHSSTTK